MIMIMIVLNQKEKVLTLNPRVPLCHWNKTECPLMQILSDKTTKKGIQVQVKLLLQEQLQEQLQTTLLDYLRKLTIQRFLDYLLKLTYLLGYYPNQQSQLPSTIQM